jgi:hypothetical protein
MILGIRHQIVEIRYWIFKIKDEGWIIRNREVEKVAGI